MTRAENRARWIVALSAMLGTLLYTIDMTIVNVALPYIQGTLQASQDQAAWIATAYIVVSAIMTPLAGWLGERYGLRRILLVAIAGFTVGSLLCAIATDLAEMVLFRMVQGFFGAALVPLSQVLLLREFPVSSHGKVMALWGSGVMIGPIVGPTLGGWLTESLSWRWAFYINLPVGLLAWFGLLAAAKQGGNARHRPFDMKGFVLLSMAIGLLQLMLDRGETCGWFESTEILAESFFAVVALYMFVAHSLTFAHPFVDLHLFRDRNFNISLLIQLTFGMFLLSPSLLLPNFLQQLQGYTPTQAGELLATRGLGSMAAMLIASRLNVSGDPRRMMIAGFCLTIVSMWQLSTFSVATPARLFALASFVQGFGIPLTFMPLTLAAFATLPDRSRTEAGALQTLARNIGGSIGISVVVVLIAHGAQTNQSYLAEHFTPYSVDRWQAIGALPGANLETVGLLAEIGRQALAIGYANVFALLGTAALSCLPLLMMLRRPPRRPASGPPAPPAPAGGAALEAAH